jgi:hypothetical protein
MLTYDMLYGLRYEIDFKPKRVTILEDTVLIQLLLSIMISRFLSTHLI